MTPLPTRLRFEFDPVNKISLIRVHGWLTDESLLDLYDASQAYSIATDACLSIVDLSSVTKFAVSRGAIQLLAYKEPDMTGVRRACFIVAPQVCAFGLCRMFQLLSDTTRPLLQIVHTLGEALAQSAFGPDTSNLQSFRHHAEPYPLHVIASSVPI